MKRIYLDNAATSWPKPETVYRAVDRYQREVGAPAGRSASAEAAEVESTIADARSRLATILGVDEPERIVFASCGTEALNVAIHGILRAGDHVVTTAAEHNSVLRPLGRHESVGAIEVTRVHCDAHGTVSADDVLAAVRPETRLLAVTHASNVTGAVQPVAEIGRRLREAAAESVPRPRYLVDAAQTLGHFPFTVADLGCDLLAAPGHKGLLGPLGTGLLYVASGVEEELESLTQGGTGSESEQDRQPDALPDKYESGNPNVPGLVGLAASTAYLLDRGLDAIHVHVSERVAELVDGLAAIEGVTLFGPPAASREGARRGHVVSIRVDGYDPQELAALLEASYGIQVRAGLHCAPAMHRGLGTLDSGGTLRFSPGPFTTPADVETAVRSVREIAAASTFAR